VGRALQISPRAYGLTANESAFEPGEPHWLLFVAVIPVVGEVSPWLVGLYT
jgi:hypothetical protein